MASNIFSQFQGVKAIVGYGSGFFKQAGRSRGTDDFVFICGPNFKSNGLGSFNNIDFNNGSISTSICRSGPSKMWYEPCVKFHDGTIAKVGVIHENDFVDDLQTWSSLYLAGRFHKPLLLIRPLCEDSLVAESSNGSIHKITDLVNDNRTAALRYSSIIESEKAGKTSDSSGAFVKMSNLMETLCRLSYDGDIRQGWAEDPRKIKQIVEGQAGLLGTIYLQKILQGDLNKLGDWVDLELSSWENKGLIDALAVSNNVISRFEKGEATDKIYSDQISKEELDALGLVAASVLDDRDAIGLKIRDAHAQIDLLPGEFNKCKNGHQLTTEARRIVYKSSLTQSMKGVVSAGMKDGVSYALKKVKKAIKGRKDEAV